MKHQLDELVGIISKLPETDVNTPYTDPDDFVGMLMDQAMPPLPEPQIFTDDDQIGDGNEWGEKLRIGWWISVALAYNAKLNMEVAARLALRGLGGTITRTPQHPAPTAAPVPTEGAAGTLTAGTYQLSYAYKNASGVTEVSPVGQVTIGANKQINLAGVTPLPAGITSVDWFMSIAANSVTRKFIANNNGAAFSINALPAGGAAVEPTTNTASSYFDIVGIMQTKGQGRIPKLSTIAYLLGGYDILHASAAVDNWGITWEGNNEPRFSAALRNTGYHLTDLLAAMDLPDPEEHHYIHPNAINASFNDGSLVDLAADGVLLGGSCGLSNNIVVKQLPGDPWLDPLAANPRKTGAYARDIHRGKRPAPNPTVKRSLGDDLSDWLLLKNGTDLTSLEYVFGSDEQIGSSSAFYEIAVKYPRLNMSAVASDTDGDDGALNLTFRAKKDTVSLGTTTVRVRTHLPTLA